MEEEKKEVKLWKQTLCSSFTSESGEATVFCRKIEVSNIMAPTAYSKNLLCVQIVEPGPKFSIKGFVRGG